MEDKGRGGNETLRTTGVGVRRAPSTMRFSVENSNGATLRSAGGGGSRAPITMDGCEGGNEGGNVATPPRSTPVINPYSKQSIPGGERNSGGDRGHVRARKVEKTRGHDGIS